MPLFGGTPTRSGYTYRPAGADPHDPRWRGDTLGSILADDLSNKDRKKKEKENAEKNGYFSSSSTNDNNNDKKDKKKKKKSLLASLFRDKKKKSDSSKSSSSASKQAAAVAAVSAVANNNNLDPKTQAQLIKVASNSSSSNPKAQAQLIQSIVSNDSLDSKTQAQLIKAIASNNITDKKVSNSDDDGYMNAAFAAFGLEVPKDSTGKSGNESVKDGKDKKGNSFEDKVVKPVETAADKEFKDISIMFGKRKHRKFHRSSLEQVGRVSLPPRGSPVRTVKLQYKDKKAGQQCRCVCQV